MDEGRGPAIWSKAHGDQRPRISTNDEISTARQAVVEGQAMAVLLDYVLAPAGHSVLDSPAVVEELEKGMMPAVPTPSNFAMRPIFLKEALTFPYRYGVRF